MNTINKIIDYFKESYQKSKLAFYCEVFETLLLVTGSAILTFTILDPATKIFVPLYLVVSRMVCYNEHLGFRPIVCYINTICVYQTYQIVLELKQTPVIAKIYL